jgi:hypothetical protein
LATSNSPLTWRQIGSFVFAEALLFTAQVTIFFLVAMFFSHFFSSEGRLSEFASSKINIHTSSEFGFTVLAISVVLGALSFFTADSRQPASRELAKELRLELTRTIYFFGATITATALAIVFFLSSSKVAAEAAAAPMAATMAIWIAVAAFSYGVIFKGLLTFGARRLCRFLFS